MGIGYRLDQRLGLTLTVFDGKVTGSEWREAVQHIFADPNWPPGRLNLTDFTSADATALTTADRDEIYAINAANADKLVGMKSATIGGSIFEAALKFRRDDQSSGLRVIAFDELKPACTWLGLDADDVRPVLDDLRREVRDRSAHADPAANGAPA